MIVIEPCPSRSWTTLMFAPLSSRCDACVCRRSCNLIRETPLRSTNLVNLFEIESGCVNVPST